MKIVVFGKMSYLTLCNRLREVARSRGVEFISFRIVRDTEEFFISFIVNKDCRFSSFQNRTLPTEDSFRLSCRISMEIAANSVEFNFQFKYLNSSKYQKNSIEIQRKLRWKWQKKQEWHPHELFAFLSTDWCQVIVKCMIMWRVIYYGIDSFRSFF